MPQGDAAQEKPASSRSGKLSGVVGMSGAGVEDVRRRGRIRRQDGMRARRLRSARGCNFSTLEVSGLEVKARTLVP